jgi:dihydrofolate reductase
MIMGRRTFESLPGILPGRRHIVISRNRQWSAHGAEAAATPEAALETAGSGSVSVIGGAEIFRAFEPHAHRIELTEVHDEPEGDTIMPPFGPAWRETSREDRQGYSFVTLIRG